MMLEEIITLKVHIINTNKLIQQGVDINNVIKNIYILGLDIVGMEIYSKIVSDNKYNIICRSVFFRDRDRDKNINNNLKSVRYSIAKNTFPYYLQNNIVHILLWLEEMLDYKSIKKIILDKLFDGDEKIMMEKCVFFRNRKDLISIDNIPHIHIFYKGLGIGLGIGLCLWVMFFYYF